MIPLKVEHVTKRYGKRTVVDDLSFVVEPGRVTGFLGPNGAGKSTTMKIMLDLAKADHGRTLIGESRYRELANPTRTVGALLEQAYHPARSGLNHLRILADAAGFSRAKVEEVLNAVGLVEAADRRVGAYSLGMRQRLGLAAALLGDPSVLVLDEPANGLDPQGIRDLRDLLRARAAAGGTVFVSSHLLAEVEHLADEVVVLNHGRLVVTGVLSDLQDAGVCARASDSSQLSRVLERAGALVQPSGDGSILVRGLTIEEVGDRACAAGIPLHGLAPQTGSLEDLFMHWTRDTMPAVGVGADYSDDRSPRKEGALP
jgi:ABC-2 type transport system ATP-binding protein